MEALCSSETSVGANQRSVISQKNWTKFQSQLKVSKFVLLLNYALIYVDVWWVQWKGSCLHASFPDPRWTWRICFSPRRLYAREKNPSVCLTGEWSGPTKGLLASWKNTSSALCNWKGNSPPSEAQIFTPNQDIPRISWNSNSQYSTHNSPATVSIKPAESSPAFVNYFFNTIPSFIRGSFKWSLPFRFPHQIPNAFIFSTLRATCPVHLISCEEITGKKKFDEECSTSC